MYCPFCGIDIPDHASVCTHCGSFINLPSGLAERDIKRIRKKYQDRYGIVQPELKKAFEEELRADYVPAIFTSRFVAFVFDWIALGSIAAYFYIRFENVSEMVPLMIPFGAFLYFTIFTLLTGRTIGKFIVGIMVVQKDGRSKPSLTHAVGRTVMSIFSGLFLMTGYLAAFFDSKNRAWHDKFSGTLVIYKR